MPSPLLVPAGFVIQTEETFGFDSITAIVCVNQNEEPQMINETDRYCSYLAWLALVLTIL